MTRRKISEYRSKFIVTDALKLPFVSWSVDFTLPDLNSQIAKIGDADKYVIKVDQGVKGRFKKGLVRLGVERVDLATVLHELHTTGFSQFIIEPLEVHERRAEKYFSLVFDRGDIIANYSADGGIDIEKNKNTIVSEVVTIKTNWVELGKATGFSNVQLAKLLQVFNENHMTMLEINPYIIDNGRLKILDLAIEIDDAAAYFTSAWTEHDFRMSNSRKLTNEEQRVMVLDEKSPASLKLEVMNADGSVFLLLSGGGASVVIADEVCNLGLGKMIGNYGEYSGNPNEEETYFYTQAVIALLLASNSSKKILFIGGAVANFTDVNSTFKGIIRAIDESAVELADQGVKIYVRRGGPGQETGLANMTRTLARHGLLGAVHDPSTSMVDAINEAVKGIKL